MSHKLLRLVFLLVLLPVCFTLFAQEEGTDDEDEGGAGAPIESDWSRIPTLYTWGDQNFCINLGLVIPLFFVEQNRGRQKKQMNLGGMGSLGYNYFLGPHLFIGGELTGMFASTVGENMYYIVPIGFRVGYQFIVGRFEFPLYGVIGVAPQSYDQRSYLGFFAKPAAGAYFRFNSDWSFGLGASYWWVPQWTSKIREGDNVSSKINIHGFFLEISLAVRYHF